MWYQGDAQWHDNSRGLKLSTLKLFSSSVTEVSFFAPTNSSQRKSHIFYNTTEKNWSTCSLKLLLHFQVSLAPLASTAPCSHRELLLSNDCHTNMMAPGSKPAPVTLTHVKDYSSHQASSCWMKHHDWTRREYIEWKRKQDKPSNFGSSELKKCFSPACVSGRSRVSGVNGGMSAFSSACSTNSLIRSHVKSCTTGAFHVIR